MLKTACDMIHSKEADDSHHYVSVYFGFIKCCKIVVALNKCWYFPELGLFKDMAAL